MSEPTPRNYEPPTIARRESIAGLLGTVGRKSDSQNDNDGVGGASDVNVKENIRPVRW